MHMSDCLGGWCFYDETFDLKDGLLEEPRFIDKNKVTKNIFNNKTKILEINSKTGLYPLYMAYSTYKQKLKDFDKELSIEEQWDLWLETIKNNIFVICKTPMAKAITQRTLLGFKDEKINAHYFEDMINQFENKGNQIRSKILKPNYWNVKGVKHMNF